MTTRLASVLLMTFAACNASDAAPAKAPTSGAFVATPTTERPATDDVLAVGDAHVALIATTAAHGPVIVRAIVNGKRTDVTRVATGDCSGGTIAELWTAADGKVIAKLGQISYSGCDDEADGVKKADISSHVECVALAWDGKKVTVAKRSPRVKSEDAVPAWCKN